ncbi:unnamed protein product, partial [Rotaria magnacalcarata]
MNQSLNTNNTYFNQPTQSYMTTSVVNSSPTAKQYTTHIPPLSKSYPINQSHVYDNSSYHQSIRTNYSDAHEDKYYSIQQSSSNEIILSQQIKNNKAYTYIIEDYESISDDAIDNTINPVVVVPISKIMNHEPGTKIRHTINVEHDKKSSREAIRRCCRKRNTIIHAHRHGFNVIRTIYRCFTVREIE